MPEGASLRDFIYLDWERMRSIASQLFAGVPQDAGATSGSEFTVDGAVEGGVPGLVKGKAGGDYRYFRSENETRSLHHHVYSLVEQRLAKERLLAEIGSEFDFDRAWTRDFFRDAKLVRIKGIMRIMDYPWAFEMFKAMPKIGRFIHHSVALDLEAKVRAGELKQKDVDAQRRTQREELAQLESLKMDELADLAQRLYGEVVRIKVVPSRQHPRHILVGAGLPNCFHDSTAALGARYGHDIDAGWITVGQVNLSTPAEDPLALPIGNQIEDALEQAVLAISQMIRLANAAEFPAVSFTPISIYRECGDMPGRTEAKDERRDGGKRRNWLGQFLRNVRRGRRGTGSPSEGPNLYGRSAFENPV